MSWAVRTLGEVAEVSWGNTSVTKKSYIADGVQAYSASGPDGFVAWAEHDSPGVVVSAIGAQCGKTWYARGSWTPIKNTLWFRSFDPDVETQYLYYATIDPEIWPRRGAAQPFISKGDAQKLPVKLPSLQIQRAVIVVLQTLDDLIENNRRRIEILEETAQLLYREWFVNFRLPGHADVEFIDSELGLIPASWHVLPFARVADFVNGFAFKPMHWLEEGLPIVKIKELKNGISKETPRYHGLDIKKKFFVDDGSVLFSWSADLDVYMWSSGPALLNQHLFDVRPREVSPLYIYLALKNRMPEFRSRAQGTTMRHIKRSALDEVRLVVAPPQVREAFESQAGPMLKLRLNLEHQVQLLLQARDLLLPRLVSGELDAWDLDLELEAVGV